MKKKISKLSLVYLSLKGKLRICFYLMSILPILVSIYFVSRYIGFKLDITILIMITISIAVIGFFVIKEIFDRIVSVSNEAKLMAAGDINRRLKVHYADEVGELGEAVNQLTQRIRDNMEELKGYGEKTTEINLGIQKRVIALTSLLQISALISQGHNLEDILRLITRKSRLLADSDIGYLLFRKEENDAFYVKVADGQNSDDFLKIDLGQESGFLNKAISENNPLILDEDNVRMPELKKVFENKFKLKNILVLPIYRREKLVAALGIGNRKESFIYKKEEAEFLEIFAKQVSIAVENDLLMHRLEKLEIRDSLTGLFNENFIRNRLQEEIKRAIAYQRPCSLIVLDVDNFEMFNQDFGELQAESALKRIASLIKDTVSDVDHVGRTGDHEFSIIAPEKNKRQAQRIAEDIRKKIEFIFSEEPDANKRITVSGTVSENPLDGLEARELIIKAKTSLGVAKKEGRNRILGFNKLPASL